LKIKEGIFLSKPDFEIFIIHKDYFETEKNIKLYRLFGFCDWAGFFYKTDNCVYLGKFYDRRMKHQDLNGFWSRPKSQPNRQSKRQ
jgi:hypothetical protein